MKIVRASVNLININGTDIGITNVSTVTHNPLFHG